MLHAVGQDVVERLARDDLGDQVWTVAVVRELVEARYRRMLERDVRAQFEKEAARVADVAGGGGAHGPERDLLVQARMLGFIQRAEAVLVHLAEDLEAAESLPVLAYSHRARSNVCALTPASVSPRSRRLRGVNSVIETVTLGHLVKVSGRRGGTADAPDLGSGARKGLEVQFLSPTLPRFWPVLMRRAVAGGLELRFR